MRRIVMNVMVVVLTCWFFQKGVRPQPDTGFQYNAFAHLPVKYEGRKKPVDTLARNLLTILSGRQVVRAENGERIEPVRWLLDNLAGCTNAMDYRVVRIENLDLLTGLGLEERKGFRYSYRELMPRLATLDAAARAAFAKADRERDLYDRQVIKLSDKLYTFQNVLAAFEDPSSLPKEQLLITAQRYAELEKNSSIPLIIPPSLIHTTWRPLMSSLLAAHPSMKSGHGIALEPLSIHMGVMLAAYREGRIEVFNQQLFEFGARLQEETPAVFEKVSFEVFYNRFGAFMKSAQLYLLIFILGCLGWLFRRKALLSVARTLLITAFIPHTFAIIARSFLSGYPPVTNLYSSAIFIGWSAVAAGIIFELGFRKRAAGLGSLVGGVAGFATLLIAHFLSGDGDTMEQMRAVLDTRFWLATHVITITLGYMATFVAGTLGVCYILFGLLTRRLDTETEDGMYRMMYGTICFALLLSFLGTVLGGLWADDSWGRFWGWDPKENGALLIVLWNAIMLHARCGRMVQQRGFAVMAVFGNVVTAWSWFGVNQLGVGLHSYGFTDSASFALAIFVLVQLAICAAGLIPVRYWKSGAPE